MPRLRIVRPDQDAVRERESKGPVFAEPQPVSSASAPNVRAGGAEGNLSREDRELIMQVQTRLIAEPETAAARRDPDHWPRRIAGLLSEQLETSGRVVSDRERVRLNRFAQAELIGLGPLEPLLADESISEIMVNGPKTGSSRRWAAAATRAPRWWTHACPTARASTRSSRRSA